MMLRELQEALEVLATAAGYPADAELVLIPVFRDPSAPQMAIAVLEDGDVAVVPGTVMSVREE